MISEDTPIGTPVRVQRDNGAELRTKTRSQPYWLVTQRARRGVAHKQRLVVVVEGITGCYDCERVSLISTEQMELFR